MIQKHKIKLPTSYYQAIFSITKQQQYALTQLTCEMKANKPQDTILHRTYLNVVTIYYYQVIAMYPKVQDTKHTLDNTVGKRCSM